MADTHDELPDNTYTIVSHGGIGDELGEDGWRERPKHNLSGSSHELIIKINNQLLRILIDMWGYQGRWKIERNMTHISDAVNAIILTHPHIDHIGDYPNAFVEWAKFQGRVFSTLGTREATEISLIDAAKILQREYEKKYAGWQKSMEELAAAFYTIKKYNTPKAKTVVRSAKGDRFDKSNVILDKQTTYDNAKAIIEKLGIDIDNTDWKKVMQEREPKKPAYDTKDVYNALSAIETIEIKDGWKELVPGQIAFRFYNAWHIIGSISIEFRITYKKHSKYFPLSGDLWSYKWDMHPAGVPTPPHNHPIDTVMIESTYGATVRENFDKGLTDFEMTLKRDLQKYRRITISTFAMDRTQNLLSRLIGMKLSGEIDADIILDSPTAEQHTLAYVNHTRDIDALLQHPHTPEIERLLGKDFERRERHLLQNFHEYINPLNQHYIIANNDNRDELLSDSERKKIVLTASGMAEWGMIIQHLKSLIGDPTSVFYFPGYLVPGSLGYALANEHQPWGQQKKVTIEWESYEVRARMKQFKFLSGHGDAEDLRAWLNAMNLKKNATIHIVHGDINGSSLEFKHSLERSGNFQGRNIIVSEIWKKYTYSLEPRKTRISKAPKPKSIRPLVMEEGPERSTIIVPENSKKPRKKKILQKSEALSHILQDNVWDAQTTNPETELSSIIQTEYVKFYAWLEHITLPFFDELRAYYKHIESIDTLEKQIKKTKNTIRAKKRSLASARNNNSSDERDESIDILNAKLIADSNTLEQTRKALEVGNVGTKISEQFLRKNIFASIGYERGWDISIDSTVEDSQALEKTTKNTFLDIIHYDSRYEDIKTILLCKDGKMNHDALTKIKGIDTFAIPKIFEDTLHDLIWKIDTEYKCTYPNAGKKDIKIRQAPKKKKEEPSIVKPQETKIIQDFSTEITGIQKNLETYKLYHTKRKASLMKTKNILLQHLDNLQHELESPRSRYKKLSLEEVSQKLVEIRQEMQSHQNRIDSNTLNTNDAMHDNLHRELMRLQKLQSKNKKGKKE